MVDISTSDGHYDANCVYACEMTQIIREKMAEELRSMGFRSLSVASPKWRRALFLTVNEETMFVLIRARGVDIMLTAAPIPSLLDPNGRLRVRTSDDGIHFGEYSYTDSDVDIHPSVLSHAQEFSCGQGLDESYFVRKGIGRSEWGAKYGLRSKPTDAVRSDEDGSLRDVYEGISSGDGEPVYMGDGMWLVRGGSLEERD